ncbi:MAG TPA: CDP-alcohol phosphatidyltransferase family protein [Thermoanaerobaculia bacterium]
MLTLPNILTLGRLLLVPCFLVASLRAQYNLAFAIFVTAAVTDVLDGWLARRLDLRSRLGALLDPAADKTLMICGFLYYTLAAHLPVVRIPGWLTFTVFVRDFLILFFAYLLYTRIRIQRFPPSIPGKISTVTQAVTVAAAIAVNAFMPRQIWVAETMFRLSLAATLFSGWHYLRRAEQMLLDIAAEPK